MYILNKRQLFLSQYLLTFTYINASYALTPFVKQDFQKRILVTTDLFGRGIDIERVNIVFNYDFPDEKSKDTAAGAAAAEGTSSQTATASDQYLHRVGRAGRFGTKGMAISFISTPSDEAVLKRVQERFAVQVPELPAQIDVSSYQ